MPPITSSLDYRGPSKLIGTLKPSKPLTFRKGTLGKWFKEQTVIGRLAHMEISYQVAVIQA